MASGEDTPPGAPDLDQIVSTLGETLLDGPQMDLRGCDGRIAERRIDALLGGPLAGPKLRLLIRLDEPDGQGGQSLFQPLGRFLLDQQRRGRITGLRPVRLPGIIGFYIELPGTPETWRVGRQPSGPG